MYILKLLPCSEVKILLMFWVKTVTFIDQVTCAKGKIDNEMKNNSLLHIISVTSRQLLCKKSASTCTVYFTGACILFAVIIKQCRAR